MMPTTAVIRSIGLWVQFFLHLYISNFVRYHGRKYVCLLLLSFPPNLMTTKKKKKLFPKCISKSQQANYLHVMFL